MKKLSGLVAAFMLIVLPTTFAHAEDLSLNSAIEELNFTLTVKWDQKDQTVKTEALKKFATEINTLKAKGLTQDQIVAGIKAQLNDAKLIADLDQLTAIAKEKKMDAAETNALVAQYAQKSQNEGASWSTGGIIIYSAATVLVLVALVIIISSQPTYSTCTQYCAPNAYGQYYCTCD